MPLKGPFPTVDVSFGVTNQLTHELPVVGQRSARPPPLETSSIWNLLCLPLSPAITSRSWKSTTKTLSGKHTNQVNPFAFLVIPVRYLLLAFPAAAFSSSGTPRTQPALLLSLCLTVDCGNPFLSKLPCSALFHHIHCLYILTSLVFSSL